MLRLVFTYWLKLRFPISALTAATCFGAVLLAPKYVRNEQLRQLCYQQQAEMIQIESQNSQRLQLISRLRNDSHLIEQFAQAMESSEATSSTHVTLPVNLSIHPDALLNRDGENPSEPWKQTLPQTSLFAAALYIATHPELQQVLLWFAVILLPAGLLSFRRTTRPLLNQLRRLGHLRYRSQT